MQKEKAIVGLDKSLWKYPDEGNKRSKNQKHRRKEDADIEKTRKECQQRGSE